MRKRYKFARATITALAWISVYFIVKTQPVLILSAVPLCYIATVWLWRERDTDRQQLLEF